MSLTVQEEIYDLENRFREMIKNIREKIKEEITIDKFIDTITEKLPQPLLGLKDHIEKENLEKKDITRIFATLDDIWDFIDYELLKFIIWIYGDKELKAAMTDYERRMETFLENTTIHDFIKKWKPRIVEDQIPETFKTCIMKLLWDPSISKLKDLEMIRQKMRKILPQELAVAAFVLCNLKSSSVTVVWLIWADIFHEVMDRLSDFVKSRTIFFIENNCYGLILDGTFLFSIYTGKVCLAFLVVYY